MEARNVHVFERGVLSVYYLFIVICNFVNLTTNVFEFSTLKVSGWPNCTKIEIIVLINHNSLSLKSLISVFILW